jgi:uncharacterized protein YdeI (YjbR/CyaY-like superfamily)
MQPSKIKYFKTQAAFRAWLERNHATAVELWVGYYKKDTGQPSITWPQSVDEALCFGWIDGIRKSVDGQSYTIRFTPRRPGSVWSAINTRRAAALIRVGSMRPAGLAAFKLRTEDRSGVYSFEQRGVELDEAYAKRFRRNRTAWSFYQSQPPGYRKLTTHWVMSAKQETTRLSRLEKLIAHSAAGERIPQLARPPRKA